MLDRASPSIFQACCRSPCAQEEWRPHYIHYPALKKIIFEIARLEQEQAQAGGADGPVVQTDEEHLLGGYANYEMAISQKEVSVSLHATLLATPCPLKRENMYLQ